MFEAMLFLVASVYFLPVLAILTVLLWISAEKESMWSIVVTAILGYFVYLGFPQVVGFLSNPINLALTVAGYLVIGVAWSFTKWYMLINKVKTEFVEFRDTYLKNANLKPGYFSTTVDLNDSKNVDHHNDYIKAIKLRFGDKTRGCSDTVSEVIRSISPKAAKHKAAIMFWIGYWPFSIIWFVISDMVREVATWIYARISGTFQRVSDSMFKDLA